MLPIQAPVEQSKAQRSGSYNLFFTDGQYDVQKRTQPVARALTAAPRAKQCPFPRVRTENLPRDGIPRNVKSRRDPRSSDKRANVGAESFVKSASSRRRFLRQLSSSIIRTSSSKTCIGACTGLPRCKIHGHTHHRSDKRVCNTPPCSRSRAILHNHAAHTLADRCNSS